MLMPIENQIIKVIKTVVPANAEVHRVQGVDALNIEISWRLNDDPERPNKMSKTIEICVSHEAAADFESASSANQSRASQRVRAFLEKNLLNLTRGTTRRSMKPLRSKIGSLVP